MTYHLGTESTGSHQPQAAWETNAERAIVANPRYFVWWYTAKSLALVAAVAWGAYLLGRSHGRERR